ncbi:AsmA family protein [Spectribacter hydrogenooxidans]|uniref:AsmA family protein n=1 Tax=Spectribacter hydrogenoxidans TaxID=3075608 RepID=A0ABU3C2L8_9GAMM|nr:AsmA family protein [Salinisphaera sp. W335]MDT0635793.1 AsmA family protein [Salinisphaera sp. W335]
MKRVIKIVLIVIGVLVALIVAAAIALPLLIDPNDYRDQIGAAVEEKTGREFTMSGDISLSVFPWLGVEIGESRLANAEGFGDEPFAEIGTAEVSVRLLPLLSKRIEVGTVGLNGLRLRLARNADGTTNWDDLVEAFASEETEEEPAPEPEPEEEGGFAIDSLEVGAVEVSDAAVTFRDGDKTYQLADVSLATGTVVLGESFPVDLGFRFISDELGIDSRTSLSADVLPDVENQFYRLSGLAVDVEAEGNAVPGGKQTLSLTGNGEADLSTGRLKVTDLALEGAGLNVAANVDGSNIMGKPAFTGQLTVQSFNPRTVMKNLGMAPPATSDDSVLTSAGLDTRFEADLNSARLDQLLIEIDDSSLKGDASVADFANPDIGFQLALDRMNVDRYLPPGAEGDTEQAAEPEEPAEAVSTRIELDPLKNLRLDGKVTAGDLTVSNLKIQDAELAVTARDGVLDIQPLGANLYNGTLRMQSTVNAASEQPSYAIKGKLNGLQLGPLVKDLIGNEKIAALANLDIDLTTTGNTVEQIKRSLDGSVSFEFRDGQFAGFDLSRILTMARNKILGGDSSATSADGTTAFSRFAASFSVTDGLLKGGDLNLNTPVAKLGGDGSFNLVTNDLDYTVNANVSEDVDNKVLKEIAGFDIPIKLTGNLFSPSYSIDVKNALKGVARQKLDQEKAELKQKVDEEKAELREKVNKEVEEEKKKLGDKLQNELREGLGGLLGGGKKKAEEPAAEEKTEEPAAQPADEQPAEDAEAEQPEAETAQ